MRRTAKVMGPQEPHLSERPSSRTEESELMSEVHDTQQVCARRTSGQSCGDHAVDKLVNTADIAESVLSMESAHLQDVPVSRQFPTHPWRKEGHHISSVIGSC